MPVYPAENARGSVRLIIYGFKMENPYGGKTVPTVWPVYPGVLKKQLSTAATARVCQDIPVLKSYKPMSGAAAVKSGCP